MDVLQMVAGNGATTSEPRPIGDVLTVVMSRYGIATLAVSASEGEKESPSFPVNRNAARKIVSQKSIRMQPRQAVAF